MASVPAIILTALCSALAARSEAASSFAIAWRPACNRNSICAISISRRRSPVSRRQSIVQASAAMNCAANRPSAAFAGSKVATAALVARPRRAQFAGSSVAGGGKAPRRIRMI